jgi:uncharacterized protein (TIGR00369 family)
VSEGSPTFTDEEMLARFAATRRRPPCSDAVGLEMLAIDQAAKTTRMAFTAPEAWCNPRGGVQGGFVTAMLDEAMAVTGLAAGGLKFLVPTLELKVSFLRPCPPGRLEATGRVVRWGKTIAYLEADLFDGEGRMVARASSTVLPSPLPGRI